MIRLGILRFSLNALLLGALIALCSCGGGSAPVEFVPQRPDVPVSPPAIGESGGILLQQLRTASGAPAGVRISWPRVDDAEVSGYYIYRDDATMPDGDPAGSESLRINSGNKITQSGTGTETLTFDDNFSPNFGEQYFYRMTVVNQTDDESDFSPEETITIAEHSIDTVTQAGGSIGDEVTITGTHFGADFNPATDEVFFTNSTGSTVVAAADSDIVDWDATEITVKIPYGAADGVVGVSIESTTVLSTDEIDYNEPALSLLNPTEDWVQNQYITLTGTDFGPAPNTVGNNTKVFFGSTEAQPADIDQANWTDTEIKVKVPAAAVGGVVNVKVSVAGNDSNTLPFTILPHLNSINPTTGQTGTVVTLTGTNFGATQGGSTVRVKGHLAMVNSWSNTSVQIVVPVNATDGNVVLTREDSEFTNGIGFDVIPTLAGLSPSRRMVGEQLTVTGTGFGNVRGNSLINFVNGDVDGVNYISWSATQVVVEVPAGAKTGAVKVEIDDNNVGANTDSAQSSGTLAVILPPPVIDDVGQL